MNKDHVDKVSDERTAETQGREAGAHVPDSEKDGEPLNRCPCCWGEVDAGAAAAGVCCAKCGTAVRWTRYDGTPEKLPEEGVAFLLVCNGSLLRQSYSFHPGAGQPEVVGDILPSPRNFKVGDLWAYLPLPPEGME